MRVLPLICVCVGLTVTAGWGQVVNGLKGLVDDSVITEYEVRQATAPAAELLFREYRSDPATLNQKYAAALSDNLEQLMERQVILHEYTKAGYSLPESLIDETIQSRIKERWGDRRTLTQSLQAEGRTYESYRRQMRDQFIIEAMRSQFLGKDPFISPRQIEDYYNAHLEAYALEDQVRLSMIVLNKTGDTNDPVPALAQEILQKIKAGESFGDLAATYSEGSQRRERGDWGWVDRSVLREELAEVAFRLQPGEVSEVIDTGTTCYIMRVEEVKAKHYKPLRDVQSEIERTLQAERRNERQTGWIDRLKRKTFVRYF
jgi:peptidyl-prolyl cis-trans isomerase SurA